MSVKIDRKIVDYQVVKESAKQVTAPAKEPKVIKSNTIAEVIELQPVLQRPDNLDGSTYKIKTPLSEHALYVTINDITIKGKRRPFEIFINSKNMEHYAWTVGLTRMISAVFRRGGDVSFVVEELKAVFDPRGGQWVGGRYVPSLLAAIGSVIERHMIDIGFLAAPGQLANDADKQLNVMGMNTDYARGNNSGRDGNSGQDNTPPNRGLSGSPFQQCPKCAQASLMRQEGCDTCTSCGYSKCG